MAIRIAQRELRNDNAKVLDRVQAGESFVVTRNGVAVADVVPHREESAPPTFVNTRDLMLRRRERRSRVDVAAWMADIRDSQIDDDPFSGRV